MIDMVLNTLLKHRDNIWYYNIDIDTRVIPSSEIKSNY